MSSGVEDEPLNDTIDYWDRKLQNLRLKLEDHFDDFDGDVNLSEYSIRQIGNDEYVISTPGKVYILGDDPISSPELDVHERGNSKEGYSQDDEKLEDLIEEELSG